ncbi:MULTISPECIES: tannase/feruloyl esterase family alpha/beta hydrolase [unclassified Bradyrhizobium]|uniref:tannase/feruloyl esterase family alpha/beta hydrolase n=1 Tax=unclassified Bradyrhizobium TaxID=2631580 RepID=UPI00291621C9|nr:MULTISPECIES: tannase/feruloyl esterase family alpha/beta hydrolase [unclassified Bradyrhizobium]
MTIRVTALTAVLLTTSAMASAQAEDFKASCATLAHGFSGSGRIVTAEFVAAGGVQLAPPAPAGATAPAPDHCLIRGKINERTGIDGKPYAVGYELRLPATWNGKVVFQGGGGVDGVVRPALGLLTGATPPNGLSNGYAVASTDAGHLEEPGPLGPYLFGLDPQARRDKGYSSIPPVAAAARAAAEKLYGKAPRRSYFAGCSNGGRQAMAVTQRFPELFDGVIAGAPAYRVPLAGIDVIAQEQALLAIAPPGPDGKADVGSALSDEDLKLVADAVTASCDGADGAKDGMVQDVMACRFDPAVLACKEGQSSQCLPVPKLKAVKLMFDGSRNSMGGLIYARWPYDPGLAAPGWRAWKLGTPKASPPNARNLTLIPGGVAYDFMSPPETPEDLVAWVRNFDLDRDPRKVMKGAGGFDAGMEYEAATSTDLDAFKAKGGKMLFYHGTADPIFSALDTVDYVDQLKTKYGADADGFARLFLVPGMNHCGGGPATDQFDLLTALDRWVEGTAAAPEAIRATARRAPDVPWPGRTRDLCAFPKVLTYKGSGSLEDAANFECR